VDRTELHVINRSGHFIAAEHPEEVAHRIGGFVNGYQRKNDINVLQTSLLSGAARQTTGHAEGASTSVGSPAPRY
jgi:hypothetical protein